MKTIPFLIPVVLILLLQNQALGQIYTWIDENGVKHFGNEPPPPDAKLIEKQAEISYDAAKDKKRQAADQKYFEEIEKMNRESQKPPEETDQPTERPPESETVEIEGGGGGVVSDSVRRRERIEHRDKRGTPAGEVATPGKGVADRAISGRPGAPARP